MPFVRSITLSPVSLIKPGVLDPSNRVYLERRLRDLCETVNHMTAAMVELQEYVESLP